MLNLPKDSCKNSFVNKTFSTQNESNSERVTVAYKSLQDDSLVRFFSQN